MQIFFFFAFTVVFKKREKQLKHNPKKQSHKNICGDAFTTDATYYRHPRASRDIISSLSPMGQAQVSYISSHLVAFLLLHYTRISLLKKGDYDQILDTVSLMARGPDELRSAGKTYWFCFITSLHEMACLVCCCPITDVHKSQEDSNKLS